MLKGEKSSKLSTNFRPSPFKVVEKTESEVTVRNDAAEEFKCNTAFVKRCNDPASVTREGGDDVPSELSGGSPVKSSSPVQAEPESLPGNEMVQASSATGQDSMVVLVRWSSRVVRKPVRFQDYVL